jgi:hypothetical protein
MMGATKRKKGLSTRDRLKPKDPKLSASWKRRDGARKSKQEAYAAKLVADKEADKAVGEQADTFALFGPGD